MWLVEQPEGGPAGEQRGECGAAALAGREATGRGRAQPPGQAEALERVVGAGDGQAEGAYGELDVLRRAEFVVERGGMPQQADVAAHRRVVRGEVHPEDGGLPRRHRQQSGTGPQEAGLARPVGPDHDHDLTLVEREIDPGKGREAAGECDRGTKVDDRGHGLPHHGRGGGCQGSKRGDQRMWASALIESSEVVVRPSTSARAKSLSAASWATRRSAVSRSSGLSSPIRW